MLAVELLLAWQYPSITSAVIVALALAAALWIPYFLKEIRRGKATLGPRLPDGASEPHPGRRGDPAPGHPEAQADPYDPRAAFTSTLPLVATVSRGADRYLHDALPLR